MTIRAILRNGIIQPLDPLPPGWGDGQELVVEDPAHAATEQELTQWRDDMNEGTARVTEEDHTLFTRALCEAERESKDAVRREWGMK